MQRTFATLALVASAITAVPLWAQQNDTLRQLTPEQRAAAALNSRTHVPLIIPAGTPLKVMLDRDVSSASVNVGDTVSFHLAADYSEYGHVLISQGTTVHGIVSKVDRRSAGGDPGNVTLRVESVRSVDGQWIPLRGTKTVAGKSRETQAAVLGILTLGIGTTKKGLTAVVPAGTEFTVYTNRTTTVVVPR